MLPYAFVAFMLNTLIAIGAAHALDLTLLGLVKKKQGVAGVYPGSLPRHVSGYLRRHVFCAGV